MIPNQTMNWLETVMPVDWTGPVVKQYWNNDSVTLRLDSIDMMRLTRPLEGKWIVHFKFIDEDLELGMEEGRDLRHLWETWMESQ